MKWFSFAIGSVAILIMVPVSARVAADRQADEAAVVDVVQTRQQQAWNEHDAKAYAALFAEDGDVVNVNVVGWWWKGRKEIENKLTDAFAFVFRDSTLTITEVDTRFLMPEVAVAHTRWTMSGAKTPPGIPEPREGIQTIVLQKVGEKWMIAAFQNTNYRPEVPFPKGPSAPVPASQPPR
jgi:uncharacterized protein (TIGR02246 family)